MATSVQSERTSNLAAAASVARLMGREFGSPAEPTEIDPELAAEIIRIGAGQ